LHDIDTGKQLSYSYDDDNNTNHRQAPPENGGMEPHAVAACRYGAGDFDFPFGGFGSYLNQALLQRLLQPINRDNPTTTTMEHQQDDYDDKDEYGYWSQLNCWQLQQNVLGEAQFFREGMNIVELMHAYSVGYTLTEVDVHFQTTTLCVGLGTNSICEYCHTNNSG
jgi:hypothetical protein